MPESPSTAKGMATQRRILDAAAEEFAANGIAGARVDRIIRTAQTNKAQLYAYFGSKESLFDAVVTDAAHTFATAVPFDGVDLADWAVRIYDEMLTRPDLVRLTGWLRLERRPAGHLIDAPDHAEKLKAIREAQKSGHIRAGDPFELMTLVIGMACAWSPTSSAYSASTDEPPAHHRRRRTLLRESVRRALRP